MASAIAGCRFVFVVLSVSLLALACVRSTQGDAAPDSGRDADAPFFDADVHVDAEDMVSDGLTDTSVPDAPPDAATPGPLAVRFLGVQGFWIEYAGEAVMTAPMFTRPSVIDVTLGRVSPDETAVTAGLAPLPIGRLRAMVTGHAHYDHLLDVAPVLRRSPGTVLHANLTAQHILAALAPDRAMSCMGMAPMSPIARERIVAADNPADSTVDYRNCPSQRPAGAPLEGRWLRVPGTRIRLRAFCSMHPDQIWFIHFGPGSVDADLCDVPPRAADWLEGHTLAWLIDFLDVSDRPLFRVYYQDAPTDGPVGHVPADVLAERAVDVALLCVGNYDRVRNQPGELVAAMRPRFALSGHWEDFFMPASMTPPPLPFLDLAAYTRRADTALPPPADAPIVVDGRPRDVRHVLAQPGMQFAIPPAL